MGVRAGCAYAEIFTILNISRKPDIRMQRHQLSSFNKYQDLNCLINELPLFLIHFLMRVDESD